MRQKEHYTHMNWDIRDNRIKKVMPKQYTIFLINYKLMIYFTQKYIIEHFDLISTYWFSAHLIFIHLYNSKEHYAYVCSLLWIVTTIVVKVRYPLLPKQLATHWNPINFFLFHPISIFKVLKWRSMNLEKNLS